LENVILPLKISDKSTGTLEIRHELFELPIARAKLFIEGDSPSQMTDQSKQRLSNFMYKGTPAITSE
jgi:hypothetical protein